MCRNESREPSTAVGQAPRPLPGEQAALSRPQRCLSSRELLGDAREVLIEHNGCHYSLRLTRQNKLILTK